MSKPTAVLLLVCCLSISATAQQDGAPARIQSQDLKRLSIEELARLDVTSVSRRTERLSRTAAAVSVIRQEDIQRSGAVMLAEAMRLGDAIDVARVNGNTWAITTRGFNINTANKLLVLVDGRSTYSPLFGGTFWDVQDMPLVDVDRIEVIRGPGAAIWGANAVNGVVNIISRPASETQGTALTLVAGHNERAIVSARYGGTAGRSHYRLFGKYRMREPQAFAGGQSAEDEVQFGQAGFRFDSDQTATNRWMVSAAGYVGTNGFADRPDGDVSGGHVLGRWSRQTGGAGELALQAYYDRSHRKVPLQFEETRNAGEIDAQQRLVRGRHTLVFGGTLRASRSDDLGIAGFRFEPQVRDGWDATAFAQDEYELRPARAYLIVGSKIGRNNFTGLELQPNVRVRYHPSERQMAWAAVSRAVRLPTRFDHDIRLVIPASGAVILAGSESFDPESVITLEGGYRIMPHPRLSLDAALFANRYDDLRSQERRPPPAPPIVLENQLNGRSSGLELAGTVQVAANWRMHGSYAWMHKTLSFDGGSTDVTGGTFEANDPSHLASVRSYLDLRHGLAFDAVLRYAGRRPAPLVPAYAELDLRLGWTVRPGWELSLVGQSLLHDRHEELASQGGPTFSFRRSVFARSIWRF
jgi:iron complex outermembrane receptor protein